MAKKRKAAFDRAVYIILLNPSKNLVQYNQFYRSKPSICNHNDFRYKL